MPIPKREKDEKIDKFMSRCMSDPVMNKEYPDKGQRYAICNRQANTKGSVVSEILEALQEQITYSDCECEEDGVTEELSPINFYVPLEDEYEDFGETVEEWDCAKERPGLWENIRRKRQREGKKYRPAKPGDKDRPDPESWKKAQSSSGDEMALEQIQKMHDQLMEVTELLKVMNTEVEFQDWTKDMISKAEIYIQNVYDFVKYYEPGKYEDEYEHEDENEEENKQEMESALFKYRDPTTNEIFFFDRTGLHKKDGQQLLYMGRAEEYQGRKVKLNKPFRTPDGPKKFAVYVKNEKGKVIILRFGDPNMRIKKNDPERRKSFRARHNCDNPGPKWKARWWSCKWSW
jgi:NACalpha-BTF3-like transcription factor